MLNQDNFNFELSQVWFLEILNWEKDHNLILNKDITNGTTELGSKTFHTEDEQKVLPIIAGTD